MAFPQTPLDVRTELRIGGTWTDVSADVYLRDPISITRGRADEASRPDHSKATITFNNRGGKYSPRNPIGPYYGQFGRNTPVRVSLPAAANYLRLQGGAGANATTPDTAVLDIVGDLDVRMDITLMSWGTGDHDVDLIGKWAGPGGSSWRLHAGAGGSLFLAWSADGTAALSAESDTVLPVPPTGRLSVRMTLDVNNGAGGNTVTFYYSTTPGTAGPWTQLGAPIVTAGTTSIFSSSAPPEIGDITGRVVAVPPVGGFHAAEVRNGIGGTVVANPVFSAQTAGTAPFADGAGRTWSMAGGAEINDRDYRAHCEISSWPPKWDVSGKDRYVPVEAAGVLRRYGQGTDPLQSTLRRRIPSGPTLIAYWPMEEGSASTQAYSPLTGVLPMQTTGLTFAADDTLPGSLALPSLSAAATIRAIVPTASTGAWRVEFVYNIATAPAGDANQTFLTFTTTGGITWRVGVGATLIHLDVTASDGTSLLTSNIVQGQFFGTWNRFVLQASQSGGSVAYLIEWINIGGAGGGVFGSYTGTVGAITSITTAFGAGLDGTRLGHLAVFDALDPGVFDYADMGFDGEEAHARISRLCTEEGIPVVFPAGAGPTAIMGPQRPAALLSLLGEAADADMGVLYELREGPHLAYRRRTSEYNQPVALALDFAADGHVAPPLEPVDDDQAARNDITTNRVNGSSAVAVGLTGPLSVQPPPDGIGPVPGGGTYNVHSDDQLPDMAGWLLHLGTWDGSRYPSVHVDLSAAPSLIPAAAALNIGDRITIAHPPPECGGAGDTLDQLAQGYTETLGVYDWDITLNCTPGGPWQVGVLDDAVLGRADTDGSQLAAAVTSTDTALPVLVTAGPQWTTDPAEVPFDIRAGGEVMTVTTVGASAADLFGRTVSSGWGSTDTGQAWTTTGGSASDYSVSGGLGRHLLASVNVSRWSTITQIVADWDITASVATTALAAGASQFVALASRFVDTSNFYAARLEFTTAAAVALTIRKRVAGTETQLAGGTVTGLTHTAGGRFNLRFQGVGSTLRAKVWTGSTEPEAWNATITDTAFTAAGQIGTRSLLNTGNTNTSPSATWDDFSSITPQRFTVTRSTNGVIKAQTAGTDVRLATPMILAL